MYKSKIVLLFFVCLLGLLTQSCAGIFVGAGPSSGSGVFGGVSVGEGITRGSVVGGASFLVNPQSSLGLQVHQEITRTRSVTNNQTVQRYINLIGQTLARNSGRPDIPFTFTVINDRNINAFAAPGGYIYITTGMLNFLKTESELAAVLAHEIGHITARHHLRQTVAGTGVDIAFDYLGQLVNVDPGAFIPQLTQLVILQRFSQREEIAADEIGTGIMSRTGYSPIGMIELLQDMQAIERRGLLSNFISSHPPSQTRVENIRAYIQANRLNKPGLVIDRPVFHYVNSLV